MVRELGWLTESIYNCSLTLEQAWNTYSHFIWYINCKIQECPMLPLNAFSEASLQRAVFSKSLTLGLGDVAWHRTALLSMGIPPAGFQNPRGSCHSAWSLSKLAVGCDQRDIALGESLLTNAHKMRTQTQAESTEPSTFQASLALFSLRLNSN